MKFITCLAILFFLASCDTAHNSDKVSAFQKVQAKNIHDLETQYGVEIRSFGGGCLHGVALFSVGASIHKRLTIEEARQLIVACTELMLQNVNSDSTVRPFLMEYPFTAKRIAFGFWVDDGTCRPKILPGELMSCRLYNGVIEYKTLRNEGRFEFADQIVVMHKETYEEAKELLREQNFSNP